MEADERSSLSENRRELLPSSLLFITSESNGTKKKRKMMKNDGADGSEDVERQTEESVNCIAHACVAALPLQFRSALQSIIRLTIEHLQASRE